MSDNSSEVVRVLNALESLSSRVERLMESLHSEMASFDALTKATSELKQDIKASKKYGTIDGAKTPKSDIERMYYSKAVQDASANFTLRADVNPNNPKWSAGLFAVKSEIDYHLNRLRKDLLG